MKEIINWLITTQISVMASSPQAAIAFVTVLDCLAIYAFTLSLRKRVGTVELSVFAFGIVVIVLVVLELIQGGA